MLPSAYARTVVDTNVLISAALLSGSVPAQVVDRLLLESILIFSVDTFAEFESRIWRPKFDRYLSMERRKSLLRDFSSVSLWVELTEEVRQQTFSRDRNDDVFIQTALAAGVLRLVSGDADLLELERIGDLRIITPTEALREIDGGS